jgi:hypothetical protein
MGHHAPDADPSLVDAVNVGAEYFKVVGVPIVQGRAFTDDEVTNRRRVTIINETLARLVVRTATPAADALPMLRRALWTLEPNIVFTEDVSAAQIADTTMAPTSIGAGIIGAFGALALLLAAIGLYGVIAYSVSLRTREVGIRMALGAAPGQVLRLILSQGGRLTLAGIGIGTLVSLGAGQLLASLLYGVSPFDPVAYGVAVALLVCVAGIANLAPAFAAARLDPLKALRRD